MRTILLLPVLALAGCVVQKPALNRPYVTARIDSPKPASDFAACSAAAMGVQVREDDGSLFVIRSANSVRVSRWDFLATNSGSQAELRSDAQDDGGVDAVRGCA